MFSSLSNPTQETHMGFGARIAKLRRDRKQSLQTVATAAGVTKTHIWQLEKEFTANPSMQLIQKLADHFGVSIAFLVDEDIDANDADQELARMFRQATDLDEKERQVLDDMIQAFRRRRADGGS
jgi:transcriptional regulator with XRE-family HTH domain